MDETIRDDSRVTNLVAGAITLATFVAAFGLLAVGWPYLWVAYPSGFGGLLPVEVAAVKW
jgi:hypothetical protein